MKKFLERDDLFVIIAPWTILLALVFAIVIEVESVKALISIIVGVVVGVYAVGLLMASIKKNIRD